MNGEYSYIFPHITMRAPHSGQEESDRKQDLCVVTLSISSHIKLLVLVQSFFEC